MYSRRSHWRCSLRKGTLRNFAKLIGKHLCRISFLLTLLKKKLWHRCFPVSFAKFLRTPYLRNTSGRLLLVLERKIIILVAEVCSNPRQTSKMECFAERVNGFKLLTFNNFRETFYIKRLPWIGLDWNALFRVDKTVGKISYA